MNKAYILKYTFSEDGRGSPKIVGITLHIEVATDWKKKSTWHKDYEYEEVKIFDSLDKIKY